ncbi:MAG: CBS domain-containing protein [Gammaproteobacteria bacterium]|nr:acetoin utilization protein AcuB [Chromatiales bacterium]MDP6675789.1 CBS domain-containing protein [Gammaproteobacteria bacterium]
MISVKEMMSINVQTLSPGDSLEDAKQLMNVSGIHHIPIIDEAAKIVGLVSHRDVLGASESILSENRTMQNAGNILIESFMTRDITTVDGRANLREAALFLQRHKYGCLPVVTDGQLKGIVTDSDFVAIAIDLLEQAEASEPEEL